MDFGGNVLDSAEVDLTDIASDVLPRDECVYDVGSAAKRFKSAHFCEGDFNPVTNSTTSFRVRRRVSGAQDTKMFNVDSINNTVDVGNETSTINIGEVGTTVNVAGSSYPPTAVYVNTDTSGTLNLVLSDGSVPGEVNLISAPLLAYELDNDLLIARNILAYEITCRTEFDVKRSDGAISIFRVLDDKVITSVSIVPSTIGSPNIGASNNKFTNAYFDNLITDDLTTNGSSIVIGKSILPTSSDQLSLGSASKVFNSLHTEDISCYNNLNQLFCVINGFSGQSTFHLQALNNEEKFLVTSETGRDVLQVNTVDPTVVVRGNFSQVQGTTTINGNATFTSNTTFEDDVSMVDFTCINGEFFGGIQWPLTSLNAIKTDTSGGKKRLLFNASTAGSSTYNTTWGVDWENAEAPMQNGIFMLKDSSSSGNYIGFWAGSTRGSITWNGTNLQYLTTSDRKEKEEIEDDKDDDLDKMMKIKCRQFKWKNGKNKKVKGLIAQEVQEIYPDVVAVVEADGNDDTLGISYMDLVPKIIHAMQQQEKTITKITKRMKNMQDIIKALEDRIILLEN